jgi:hypothetical protein
MSANILTFIALGASILALILGVAALWISSQSRTLKKYFKKENQPENLEEVVEHIISKLTELDAHANQTSNNLSSLAHQLNTATQHVGIIRYNGNGDDGGNLSFSAALLDAHQSGIVLTSLHGRQNNRIYAKVITEGASESTLSEEEREALILAITNKTNSGK